ncbi:hypothetical protein EFP84_08430 [Leptospira kmetyi]|uniref:Uncharacterized protein n=1 Tax=Leptospira kmetyi TaxID=408139 RepID=A0AAD0UNA7_9LEPT|nr:hypothetical protein EFP84_08430 [Leptospira kmetyi]
MNQFLIKTNFFSMVSKEFDGLLGIELESILKREIGKRKNRKTEESIVRIFENVVVPTFFKSIRQVHERRTREAAKIKLPTSFSS